MNKVYALVWNQALGCWNVTPEGARRRGKSSTRRIVVAAVAALGLGALSPAFALPVGGTVVSGTGDILNYGNGQMSINQHSDKLITNWNDFSISAGQKVTFNQPTTSSVALNRVVGNNVSSLKGQLNANGRVFLVNPNGIVIGQGGQVNVGSLVATTQKISDADFLAGKYHFVNESNAEIVNYGVLTAAPGGNIALLGAQVRNNGTIQAQMGRVALGAGGDFTVNFDGNNLLNLQVNEAAVNAMVQNGGLLKADGGQVLMAARGADTLLQAVVNNQGSIEAKTLRGSAGKITLDGGDLGTVQAGGALIANALNSTGNGGSIEVTGANVEAQLGTQVSTEATNGKTGTWKISSSQVNVSPTAASVGGTTFSDTLSRNLATTNIELASTQGDLTLNGPVSWKSANALTLTSAGDVNLNGALTATGNLAQVKINAAQDAHINSPVSLTGLVGGMSLNYGGASSLAKNAQITLSGSGSSYQSNGDYYNVIHTIAGLQNINANLNGLYVLGNPLVGRVAFDSIGGSTQFTGTFDGLGNTISGLVVRNTASNLGLFAASSGSISNLKLASMSVVGGQANAPASSIGALVGLNSGKVSNVATTNVTVSAGARGNNTVGGLVGSNLGGAVERSSSQGVVVGNAYTNSIGGLVGESSTSYLGLATVTDSISQTNISGSMQRNYSGGVGGLVGANNAGYITDSSSKGSTLSLGAGVNVGGLVGYNENGILERNTTSGAVRGAGAGSVGGLVGLNVNSAISASSASGTVMGTGSVGVGGLVGTNLSSTLSDVKASGNVTDTLGANIGGLVGNNANGSIDTAEAQGIVLGGNNGRVGGLIGNNYRGSVAHSVARGKTTAYGNSHVGGLVGYNDGSLQSVEASGAVLAGASSFAGGLVGTNGNNSNSSIESAFANGNVQGGVRTVVGGLVGQNNTRITNSAAAGTVSGAAFATLGGLVGLNQGDIHQSVASGKVNFLPLAYRQIYGGLVGMNYGEINYSGVSGEASLAPLVGTNQGYIR